jgi:RimJ/RimL family protein N-acetyltransferase
MEADVLGLMHDWLQRPHVRRWWSQHETYQDVAGHYLPAIDGADPTDLYVVLLDDRPIGFMQTYLVADYPEYEAVVDPGDGAAGVDLFIGEPELTGRGIGSEMLRRFVSEIVLATPSVRCCIADPEAANVASVRAFENAGFHIVKEFVDPGDGKTHALVRREKRTTGRRDPTAHGG